MQFERLSFGFFLVLALALDAVFLVGEIDNIQHHSEWVLTGALLAGMFAAAIKLGDRSQVGLLLLSATTVAVLLLLAGRIVWTVAHGELRDDEVDSRVMVSVVALAFGALVAYLVAVVTLVGDALMSRR